MKQAVAVLLILFSAYIAVSWLGSETPPAATGQRSEPSALRVNAAPIQYSNSAITLQSFGNLEAEERFQIHALVGGQIIRKSNLFKNGERVEASTVLLEIDPTPYALAVALAESEVAAAELALADEQARAQQAERDWAKRNDPLLAKDFVLRKPHLRAASARLNAAKASLSSARLDLERTKVKAGFNGQVSAVNAQVGAVVTASASLGAGFTDQRAEIRLPINASDLGLLQEGSPSVFEMPISLENTLTDIPEYWDAQFVRIESNISSESQQVFLVAQVNRPFEKTDTHQALLPGQYMRARISGPEIEQVFEIPNSHIYQGTYVYLAASENRSRLERRDVEVFFRGENSSLIRTGLNEGEWIISTVLGQLPSGTEIEVLE